MLKRLTSGLIHVAMLAIVCAIAAYWGVRILTPQPTAAPPPLAAPPPRDPDPVLAARMFGLVQQAQARVAANIQVAGIFAAGSYSSAVLTVDGKPPRVYVLNQEVTPGTRIVDVTADTVVLESGGVKQELKAPPRPLASLAAGEPARAYVLEGNSLSPTGSAGGAAPVPTAPYTPPALTPPQPPPQVFQPQALPPGIPPPPRPPSPPADTSVPGQAQPPPPLPQG